MIQSRGFVESLAKAVPPAVAIQFISRNVHNPLKSTEPCPKKGLGGKHTRPCSQSKQWTQNKVSETYDGAVESEDKRQTYLKEGMACNNRKEALETLATRINNLV